MLFKAICLIICSFFAVQNALAIEVCGDLKQGELLLIKGISSEKILLSGNYNNLEYDVLLGKTALVALHRDTPKKIKLSLYPYKSNVFFNLNVAPAKWNIQRVNGVAEHKVTPDKKHQKEIDREIKDVNKALSFRSDYNFWREGFIIPVEGRISGYFGNQRIFNGVPKNPHNGTDIAAPEGTPVKASGSGKVVLSEKDYFYTGNMVIIDHGAGLYTIYAHLQKFTVNVGDIVKQGDVIGFVGKTGRATGAHLHWGAVLNGIRFRPQSLLNINNKSCKKMQESFMGE